MASLIARACPPRSRLTALGRLAFQTALKKSGVFDRRVIISDP